MFGLIVLVAAFVALGLRHYTTRWFQRVCSRVGDVPSKCGLAGHEVAERLLAASGLKAVGVRNQGALDCYHPWKRQIFLRPETHDAVSLSTLATAAHEVGHAQHFAEKILPCRLRFVFWPICWALPLIAVSYAVCCFLGVVTFSEVHIGAGFLVAAVLLVALQAPISLPLERDATRRAKKLAEENGLLAAHERVGFDRVLEAAWKSHLSAEFQRWLIFLSIGVAAGGYLWYASYQNRLAERLQENSGFTPVAAYQAYPETSPAFGPVPYEESAFVDTPPGLGIGLWLVQEAGYLLAIGLVTVAVLTGIFRQPKSKPASGAKLTKEQQAVHQNNRAYALLELGNFDDAIETYNWAIELNPQLTAAWYGRGQTYLHTGQFEEALQDFETAARLAPHFLDAITMCGHARLSLGREEAGLAELETVLAADPDNLQAHLTRAEYWFVCEQYERAIPDWDAVIDVAPDGGDYFRGRGLTHYYAGNYDRAAKDAAEAIELNAEDSIAWNNRGAARLHLGDYAAAESDLREAIRLDPELPNAYQHLAWLQATCPEAKFRNGEEAVVNAKRALELTGWKIKLWFEVLAAAHAEARDLKAACQWQQKFVAETSEEKRAAAEARLVIYENDQPFRDAVPAISTDDSEED